MCDSFMIDTYIKEKISHKYELSHCKSKIASHVFKIGNEIVAFE